MSQELWTQVDQYLGVMLVPEDETTRQALRSSVAAGLPAIHVSPTQAQFLWILARSIGARRILEIGTLGGYSSIWLARALAPGGKLITLEAIPLHAQVAQSNLERAGLSDLVELRQGLALNTLPQLAAVSCGPFDLVFIDADKPNAVPYFDWALELSRPGSLIIVDNVIRQGEIIDPASADPDVRGMRRLNERISGEPRVTATALQTVGSKGYDGFVIAIVNGDPAVR